MSYKSSLPVAIVIIILTGVALYLRAKGIYDWHFEGNEAGILLKSNESLFKILIEHSRYTHEPPLKNIILHYLQAISSSPTILRIPSMIAGVLMVPFFYAVGNTTSGRVSGVVMASIAAVNYELIVQSQLLRMYSVFGLCVCLVIWSFFQNRHQSKLSTTVYFLSSILALYVHYGSIIPIVALNLSLLPDLKKGKYPPGGTKVWIAGHILLAAFWCFHVLLLLSESGNFLPARGIPVTDIHSFLHSLKQVALYLFFIPGAFFPSLIAISSFAGLLLLIKNREWKITIFVLSTFIINILLALVGKYPFYSVRHCIFLIPCFGILSGYLFQRLSYSSYPLIKFMPVSLFLSILTMNVVWPVNFFDADSLRLARRKDFPVRISDHQNALEYVMANYKEGQTLMVGNATYLRMLIDSGEHSWPFGGYVAFKKKMREMYLAQKGPVRVMVTKETFPLESVRKIDLIVCWNTPEEWTTKYLHTCIQKAESQKLIQSPKNNWIMGPTFSDFRSIEHSTEDRWDGDTAISFKLRSDDLVPG